MAPDAAKGAKWLADAFIQLIQTITGPVIFVTVVVGIASLGSLARAGGLALRALAYFLTMTVIALVLGLIVANVVQPGAGFAGAATEAGRTAAQASIKEAGGDSGFVSFITGSLLPDSFLGPFVENDILKVLVLAIVTAAATMVIAKWQGSVMTSASRPRCGIRRRSRSSPSARCAARRSRTCSGAAPAASSASRSLSPPRRFC